MNIRKAIYNSLGNVADKLNARAEAKRNAIISSFENVNSIPESDIQYVDERVLSAIQEKQDTILNEKKFAVITANKGAHQDFFIATEDNIEYLEEELAGAELISHSGEFADVKIK